MGVNKQETMGIYISYFVTGTKNKYLRKNVSKRCQIIISSCNELLEDTLSITKRRHKLLDIKGFYLNN